MALFGPSDGGSREPRSLVEFRAGKMQLKESTHMVVPDKRKGLIFMKIDNDGLLHFYWKDRQHGRTEDDFTIFPEEAEMKRVPQCTTGRVYLLRFKNNPQRKFFYWMQEPNEAKDADLIKKVNDLMNNPPEAGGGEGDELPPGIIDSGALQALLGQGGNVDREQLMEMLQSGRLGHMFSPMAGGSLGGSRAQTSFDSSRPTSSNQPASSATTATTPATARVRSSQQAQQQQQQQPRQQLQLSDLQTALSAMGVAPPASGGGATGRSSEGPPPVSLSQVVTGEALREAAGDPAVIEQLQPLLPETGEDPVAVVSSPQFQQAVGVFGSALQSGQLGPLMAQFGLGQQAVQAANEGDTAAFTTALQNEMSNNSEQTMDTGGEQQMETGGNTDQQQTESTNNNEDDDDMNVD
ncbi:proteasomal ubiquitin receptor ADRM1-A-like [Dysidea avara]|uniref:proteasomal ubiquitin receptor ADRM1-A-like n=1 Tax=Dysidea avara TaxID=196820 RepID=UPI003330AF5A